MTPLTTAHEGPTPPEGPIRAPGLGAGYMRDYISSRREERGNGSPFESVGLSTWGLYSVLHFTEEGWVENNLSGILQRPQAPGMWADGLTMEVTTGDHTIHRRSGEPSAHTSSPELGLWRSQSGWGHGSCPSRSCQKLVIMWNFCHWIMKSQAIVMINFGLGICWVTEGIIFGLTGPIYRLTVTCEWVDPEASPIYSFFFSILAISILNEVCCGS